MKSFLPFIFCLTFLMASCSKAPGKTVTKLKIISGNISTLLSTNANNGLFFYGRSTDGKVFTKKIDSDSIDLVFPNGTWNFYAVAYHYPTPGAMPDFNADKNSCGKTRATFTGVDTTVSIDLSNNGCNDPDFSSDVHYMSQFNLPTVKVFTCKDLSGALSSSSCGTGNNNKGYATSYRLVAYEGKNFGEATAPVKIAQSACFRTEYNNTMGGITSSDIGNLTDVHIPTNFANGFNVALEVFYASGASGTFTACDSSNGVDIVPLQPNARSKYLVNNGMSFAADYEFYIKSDASDVCRFPRTAVANFAGGFGNINSPYAICSKNQLDLLRTSYSTYSNSFFDLLTDIDYNMNKIAPIGIALSNAGSSLPVDSTNGFRGILNGNFHKISNFIIDCKLPGGSTNNDVGFFRKISDGAVKNLTMNNAVIMCDDGYRIGVLAGQIFNDVSAATFENLFIHGHADGYSKIGGLAGLVTMNGAGSNNFTNVHVKGDYGATDSLGGLIGQVDGSASSSFSKVSFSGELNGEHGGSSSPIISKVGGLIGFANSTSSTTIDNAVVKSKKIEASTTVGSFVGKGMNVILNDSYSDAFLSANGNTNGSSSFADVGGAIGNATGGSVGHVLFVGGLIYTNRGSSDHTAGGMIGRLSTTVCSNNFYNITNDGAACGVNISFATAKTLSNYTTATFSISYKAGNWNVSGDPTGTSVGACSVSGQYFEASTAGSTSLFGTSVNMVPGDLALCDGSVWNFVPFSSKASALSAYTWNMNDQNYDFPRLSFELNVDQTVDYLRRPCQGRFNSTVGAGTAANPYWVCSYSQFTSMSAGTFYTLQNDIFMDTTYHSPLGAGTYLLDGNGYSLKGFSMLLPSISGPVNYGIFAKLQALSVVKNMSILGASLKANNPSVTASSTGSFGLLAGINNGTIFNVDVIKSAVDIKITSAATNTYNIGGMVGYNLKDIVKGEIDASVNINGGDYATMGTPLYAGGVVGVNDGTLSQLRSHSNMQRTLLCSTSGATLTFPTVEYLAPFVGWNNGTINQVDVEGEFRSANINPSTFTDCKFTQSGNVATFISKNDKPVYDFKLRPRMWLENSNSYVASRPVGSFPSVGSLQRGIIEREARDSFLLPLQFTPANMGTWSASAPPAVACSGIADLGKYVSVTASNPSSYLGSVVSGDFVYCNGSYPVVVSASLNNLLNVNANMSEVITIAKNPGGYCTGYPWFFDGPSCSGGGGGWGGTIGAPLVPGNYYDDDLEFTPDAVSGNLIITKVSTSIDILNSNWNVGTDFLYPGSSVWNVQLEGSNTYSIEAPDLSKTKGGLDSLGPIFK